MGMLVIESPHVLALRQLLTKWYLSLVKWPPYNVWISYNHQPSCDMSSPSKSSLLVQASDKGALISENASADIFAPRSPTQVSAADQECIGTLTDLVDAIDRTFATAER